MRETWKPVPGYEGLYEASSLGQVRSIRREGTSGGVLAWYVPGGRDKHPRITLSKDGKQRPVRVHRVIILTFKGEKPPGKETRHLDGNHMNCAVKNLVYGTHAENTMDAVDHGTHPQSSKTHCSKAGHPLSGDNLYVTPEGKRGCRECRRAAYRRWYHSQKQLSR